MANKSHIEWTDATWSPVTGCTKVSDGCKNCYAAREVETRWSKNPRSVWYGRPFTDVQCHDGQLGVPLHWRKPRRIFVCPRADLFHESVPDAFIDKVFAVMALAPQHTFQVLTKRAARMQIYSQRFTQHINDVQRTIMQWGDSGGRSWPFPSIRMPRWEFFNNAAVTTFSPLRNVHIGVSVEHQAAADERIPLLLETPAAVRWVSAEPLLGPVNIEKWLRPRQRANPDGYGGDLPVGWTTDFTRLDWIVAGGESGPKARPMHPNWVRSLRDQCQAAGVPFLFKQWGEWAPYDRGRVDSEALASPGGLDIPLARFGKRAAGRLLDGVLHDDYPVPA